MCRMTKLHKVRFSVMYILVGHGDNVKCFYCDGGLRNWEPGDDPWQEHAKWFPRYGSLPVLFSAVVLELIIQQHLSNSQM